MKPSKQNSCSDFKNEVSTFEKGGYNPLNFMSLLPDAITNAKNGDSDPNHFLPKSKKTKVYQLGEAIIEVIGKNGLGDFVNEILPNLIQNKFQSRNKQRRKSKKA